jgi:hypothetical protein
MLVIVPSVSGALDASRRGIPEGIKREVRQRCGFGCVVCGAPVYEYHHMIEWSISHHHDPNEITLLCPNDHAEATGPNASLPSSVVREFDANPATLRVGMTSSRRLHYRGDVSVVVGGMTARRSGSSFTALSIGGEKVIWVDLEDGAPLLGAHIWDKNGATLLRIKRGEWSHSVTPWDVTFVSNVLTMREAKGRFLIQVRFATPDTFAVDRGVFYGGQRDTVVTPGVLILDGNTYEKCGAFENEGAAVSVGGLNSTLLKATPKR